MKKKLLVSLVLLAIIGASVVFAQQPTLDKLTFTLIDRNTAVSVKQANKDVSGTVVIPDTYDGKPVTTIGDLNNNKITGVIIGKNVTAISMFAFGVPGFSSITFPASVQKIGNSAFNTMLSSKLTSVTFEGSSAEFSSAFPGYASLLEKYQAGGAGTYTRQANGNIWTKVGGAPAPAPVNTSLNGVWETGSGEQMTINGNSGTVSSFGSPNQLTTDAINKGYLKVGDQRWRNISSTGNLTWSGQQKNISYNTSSPNVATGTEWVNTTITMSADGRTINVTGAGTWTRR